ncbi:MAG: hemerythrin domain-containing protein [Fimbriimonadaceae bacterium]|nr:hemerythrin domain-containing protein [Alphaproteobacteria bacterium]
MFDLNLSILRSLHEEHAATLAVLERFEKLLTTNNPQTPPDISNPEVAGILRDVATVIGDDVSHHFAFEETHLFPKFEEFADPAITQMLRQEHELIRPMAERLGAIIKDAKDSGFTPESWAEFHETGSEITEREIFHIQKEEMGFLPALDQMLDEDDDGPLQMAYIEMKGG